MMSFFSSIRLYLIFSLVWFMVGQAQAQQISVQISPRTPRINESAEFTITINGLQQLGDTPIIPDVEGLSFGSVSTINQFESINGVVTQRYEFSWQVVPRRSGSFTIPPIEIMANGQALQTEPLTFEVKEGRSSPDEPSESFEPIMEINVGKKELWLGEVTPISLHAYFHYRTQLRSYDLAKLPRENFVVKRFPPPQPTGMVEINGDRYQEIRFQSSVSAIRAGELVLGPAEFPCTVDFPLEAGQSRRGGIFQRMSEKQIVLNSPTVTITVKPLPEENKPANFAGTVGQFTLTAHTNFTQGKVGEPIAIDFMISGVGNFESVVAPTLTATEGWKLYPSKITQENRSTGLEPSSMSYNQVIVPQKNHPEIPPFSLSFFDPSSSSYRTVKTSPIPIKLSAEDPATADAVNPSITRDFGTAIVSVPEEKLADILTLRPSLGTWMGLDQLKSSVSQPSLHWHLIPALFLLGLIGWRLGSSLQAKARLAQAQKAHLPRAPRTILHDIQRSEKSSAPQIYRLTQELMTSLQKHDPKKFDSLIKTPEWQSVAQTQNQYLYAPDANTNSAPLTTERFQHLLTVLKRWVSLLLILAVASVAKAKESPDDIFQIGETAFAAKDFDAAYKRFESLVKDQKVISPNLAFNLGNTAFRLDRKGEAALWYQRALLLDPTDLAAWQNLRITRLTTGAQVFNNSTLGQITTLLPASQWFHLFLLSLWITLLIIVLYYWRRRRWAWLWLSVIILGSLGSLFLLSLNLLARKQIPLTERALVTANGIAALSGPTDSAGVIIDLPPGTEIIVKEVRGPWAYVVSPGQRVGWVKTDSYTKVWPIY